MKKLTIVLLGIIVFLLNASFISKNSQERKAETTSSFSKNWEQEPFTTIHIFEAKLSEIKYRLCPGRTSLCPKTCGNSGEFANFRVLKYNKLLINGEARKEKMATFTMQLSDYNKKKLKNNYSEIIKTLKPGDLVKINVAYIYDTTKSSVRTIEEIKSVTKI